MKPADLKILSHIRSNARMNLTTISRKTGIPVSTIFDRLRSHEGKLITRFTALLDFAQLGYTVRANVFLRVAPSDRQSVKHYLLAHQNVNNLWRVNNGYDYALECLFHAIKDAEEFLEELDSRFAILDRHMFHVIEDIAREKVMMNEMMAEC